MHKDCQDNDDSSQHEVNFAVLEMMSQPLSVCVRATTIIDSFICGHARMCDTFAIVSHTFPA